MNADVPGVDRRHGSRCSVERSPLLPRRPSALPTTTVSVAVVATAGVANAVASVASARIVDSRAVLQFPGAVARVAHGGGPGRVGIPAGGRPAVLATVTAETATGRGYVTVWPVRVRRAGIGAAVIL